MRHFDRESASATPLRCRRSTEELATLLLESVPTESPEEVEVAWVATIRRRVQELESGAVTSIPWEEVRKKLVRSEGGA